MNCSSCEDKFEPEELNMLQSALMPLTLYLCGNCHKMKIEPRYVVLMAFRQYGKNGPALEYIRHKRYFGPEISVKETL